MPNSDTLHFVSQQVTGEACSNWTVCTVFIVAGITTSQLYTVVLFVLCVTGYSKRSSGVEGLCPPRLLK